jgi:nitrate reductase gamma subunit
MWDKIWYVVMVPMVYCAVAWCIVGVVVKISKILKAPDKPRPLRIFPEGKTSDDPPESPLLGAFVDAFTMPTIRKYQPTFWVFLIAFHVGVVLLICAHLDLLPQMNLLSRDSPHMIGNGAVGAVVTVCLIYFLFRRFVAPVREVSVASDYLLLFLLLGICLTGDLVSWGNSWSESGFVMTKQDFGVYLDNLLKFTFADPRKFLSGGHYPIVGTHILLANLFLILLPFSKIMHFAFAVPLNKIRRG